MWLTLLLAESVGTTTWFMGPEALWFDDFMGQFGGNLGIIDFVL